MWIFAGSDQLLAVSFQRSASLTLTYGGQAPYPSPCKGEGAVLQNDSRLYIYHIINKIYPNKRFTILPFLYFHIPTFYLQQNFL